jgi:hypothetical protein
MAKKETNKEVAVLSEEQLAFLNESYPVSTDSSRLSLPKFGMLAKDIVEETGTGKNKKIDVIQASGTFFTEKDEGETNEEGKKVWTKNFLDGETIDVQIVYHRYQLRYFDKGLEKFISSPIYDTDDQKLPLYLDKRVIATGTEKELQALYPAKTAKGKPTSNLKKMTILYVIYEGELYQFGLSVSSGWEFSGYKRKVNPSTVITTLSSTEETFGVNTFRKTLFDVARPINPKEFEMVKESVTTVKEQVESDAQFLLTTGEASKDEINAEEVYKNM